MAAHSWNFTTGSDLTSLLHRGMARARDGRRLARDHRKPRGPAIFTGLALWCISTEIRNLKNCAPTPGSRSCGKRSACRDDQTSGAYPRSLRCIFLIHPL